MDWTSCEAIARRWGKLPLIKRTYVPPLSYFREAVTPNNAFFVRYHLASIPEIKAADWRLRIGGEVLHNIGGRPQVGRTRTDALPWQHPAS
ncbi:hypothetical protein [Cupriavidus necator]